MFADPSFVCLETSGGLFILVWNHPRVRVLIELFITF